MMRAGPPRARRARQNLRMQARRLETLAVLEGEALGALRARGRPRRSPRPPANGRGRPSRLLGAYTTFSTWMVEADRLGERGAWPAMGLHLLGSMAAGLAATGAGWVLGTALG